MNILTATIQNTENISSESPVIPTLQETTNDVLYLRAYCPICDKSETAKVEFPGQPRDTVASVLKIREHL